MTTYESDLNTEGLELAEPLDRRAYRFYGFIYRPEVWQANTEYTSGMVVIPTTPNGKYYKVKVCGVSGVTEPTDWGVVDGTVEWAEYCYKLLPQNVTISASTWEANDAAISLTLDTFDDISTRVLVGDVPADIEEVILTNITTRSNSEIEVRSMRIPIANT